MLWLIFVPWKLYMYVWCFILCFAKLLPEKFVPSYTLISMVDAGVCPRTCSPGSQCTPAFQSADFVGDKSYIFASVHFSVVVRVNIFKCPYIIAVTVWLVYSSRTKGCLWPFMHEVVGTGNIKSWLKIDCNVLKVTKLNKSDLLNGTDRFGG